MSFEFLGAKYVRRVAVESARIRGVAMTRSLHQVESLGSAQAWRIMAGLQTDALSRMDLLAKVEAHRRTHQNSGTFSVPVPQPPGQSDPPAGTVFRLHLAADAGAKEIRVIRTAGDEWTIPVGRYFRIAGDAKVYATLEELRVPRRNVSPATALKIYPPLRKAAALAALPANNPVLSFADVEATVRWDGGLADAVLEITDGSTFSFDASFLEAV